MEPSQLICEEWGSLSGLYTAEEADFMTQLLAGNYSVSEKHCVTSSVGMPSAFWPGHESTEVSLTGTNSNSYLLSNVANTNYLRFSQGSGSSTDSGNVFSTTSRGIYSCETATNLDSMSQGYCFGESKFSPHGFQCNDNLRQQINKITREKSGLEEGKPVLADNFLQAMREYERMVFEPAEEARSINLENPAKRLRSSFEVSTNMRNIKSRKENPILASMTNNEDNGSVCLELHGGASSNLSTEGPSAPNLDRRASNGAATDPQSLYARKRRERINERLRILQTLVPNGTKVDISTMLEEAVQYVKFLQLQIKLLSSDDLWMYAPIAFNGMNIGLDLTITPPTKGR